MTEAIAAERQVKAGGVKKRSADPGPLSNRASKAVYVLPDALPWRAPQDEADFQWHLPKERALVDPTENNYLWIKAGLGFADLTFDNTTAYQLKEAEQYRITGVNGNTPNTRCSGDPDRSTPIRNRRRNRARTPKVLTAFQACEKLLRFYRANQSTIDDAANRSTP